MAYEVLIAGRGKHFDPEILDVFLQNRRGLEAVQEEARALSPN